MNEKNHFNTNKEETSSSPNTDILHNTEVDFNSPQQANKKSNLWVMIFLSLFMPIILIITIIFIIPASFKNYIEMSEDIVYIVEEKSGNTVYYNNEKLKTLGGTVRKISSSDNYYNYITNQDESSETFSLYRIHKDKLLLVDNGIMEVLSNAQYADTIAYISENKLMRYQNGDIIPVYDNAGSIIDVKISNNGEYIVYTVKGDDSNSIMYLFDGKNTKKIDNSVNLSAINVSDNGNYIYAKNKTDKLYCINDNDLIPICDKSIKSFYNISCDEALIWAEKDDGIVSYIYVPEENESHLLGKGSYLNMQNSYNNRQYCKTFKNSIYMVVNSSPAYSVYTVDPSYKPEKIVDKRCVLDYEHENLYYLDNKELYQIKLFDEDFNNKVIANNVESYRLTNSGEIYYKSESGVLYYSSNTKEFQIICDYITDYIVIRNNDSVLFTDEDKQHVQYSQKGKTHQDFNINGELFTKLPQFIESTESITLLYFYYDDFCDIYYSDKKDNYSFLIRSNNTPPILFTQHEDISNN